MTWVGRTGAWAGSVERGGGWLARVGGRAVVLLGLGVGGWWGG